MTGELSPRDAAYLDDAIIVAIGGNLAVGFASLETLLDEALADLETRGVAILERSPWWRSAAWPDPTQPEYRNAVVRVATVAPPREVLATLLAVEADFARRRSARNAPRTIDLDLIAYGRTVLATPSLTVPHPRAHDRLFVMGPLAQIAPAWRHPVSGRTAADLAAAATVGVDACPVA